MRLFYFTEDHISYGRSFNGFSVLPLACRLYSFFCDDLPEHVLVQGQICYPRLELTILLFQLS